MSDVFTPITIREEPIPTLYGYLEPANPTVVTPGNPSNGYQPTQVTPTPMPIIPVAVEVQSQTFDTQQKKILGTFSFGQVGALQIGTYVFGSSGDVRITPNGITARDINGLTTFTLDGTTGNATFKGTVSAGSLIAGAVNVGSASVQIDGANGRIIVNDGTTNRVVIGNV